MASDSVHELDKKIDLVRINGNNPDGSSCGSLHDDVEDNWGFSLEEVYKLALQFYKG
jgi:hypothetical protein